VGFYRVSVGSNTSFPIYIGISGYSSIVIADVSTPSVVESGKTITVSTTIAKPIF
jgi:hypothetical protein